MLRLKVIVSRAPCRSRSLLDAAMRDFNKLCRLVPWPIFRLRHDSISRTR